MMGTSGRDVREVLVGPIPSIRTPFNRDGSIDYPSLDRMIDFCLDAGCAALMLTAGDSHYLCLSDDEIAEVTRRTCRRATGKAAVIAADRYHATDRAVNFARFARDAGADIVMCMPPDWGGSCTEQTLAEHYAHVAKIMPVMLVTNVFIPRGAAFGLRTVEITLEQSDQVLAIKDDFCGEFARKLCLLTAGRIPVLAGGQKQNHLDLWPYGCAGYLSTFITFQPRIAKQYWSAIKQCDVAAARAVIRDFDIPLFDTILPLPGGFDAGLHAILEILGLAQRWRRKPYLSLGDEQIDRLREFLKRTGIA